MNKKYEVNKLPEIKIISPWQQTKIAPLTKNRIIPIIPLCCLGFMLLFPMINNFFQIKFTNQQTSSPWKK